MAKNNAQQNQELAEIYKLDLPCTREDAARALHVSIDTISEWTRQGMPCLYIGRVQRFARGSRPRYILRKCLAWLENRNQYR